MAPYIDPGASPEKTIRNLTQAFEALKTDTDVVSPTGVAEHPSMQRAGSLSPMESPPEFPQFQMHPILQRDLPNPLVHRVSFYSIIHDINKEAAAMYAQDPLYQKEKTTGSISEDSPLVDAVLGRYTTREPSTTTDDDAMMAVIDEEEWLLQAIAARSSEETALASEDCPATFLQAMGEKEYPNPMHSVAGHTRTQLWKPSRSWWEAKSGKNPWIEPSSHNKRWRYLWPLIHYHKFLAKCIKKLKRNLIDVKQSVSPVAVFLREEVCAVSDHLASVSMFGSEEWMKCLELFSGWIVMTDEAEAAYRHFISELKLRPIQEPGDVESPLLRSQIDENFLRSMAAQRDQMKADFAKKSKVLITPVTDDRVGSGAPPMYPRATSGSNTTDTSNGSNPVPRQIHGIRRPRYFGWWNGSNWEQTPPPPGIYADNSSVQSGLSTDSYHRPPSNYDYGMYQQPGYYPHPPHHPPYPSSSDHSYSTGYDSYSHSYSYHMDVNSMYGYHYHYPVSPGYYPPTQETPETPDGSDEAVEQDADMQASPYWAHLDQATMAMGLATPAKTTPHSTPGRRKNEHDSYGSMGPYVRQHYYGHPYPAADPYAPPSPATQFMMSPGYHYSSWSPHRNPKNMQKRLSTVPARDSPTTVETTPDSESN